MERHTISRGFVGDALDCLAQRGIDVDALLHAAGLPPDLRNAPSTPSQFGCLWIAAAAALDDEFFGLAARPMRPGSFALLCHAVLHASTLETALRRALRFLRVVLDEPHGELRANRVGQAQIVLHDRDPARPAFAHRTFWLILMGLACWLVGRRIPLRRIDFACPAPAHRDDYREFFGAPVHFDQPESRLLFDASHLQLPTLRSPQALKTFLRGAPANILVRYKHDAGWATRIRDHLKQIPTAHWPDFDTLAQHFKIAPATLRRRLRGEGQSFAALKDELRDAQARTLLRDGKLDIIEIAETLGFSEPSAFHRAFRKWSATSPAAYRRDWLASRGS